MDEDAKDRKAESVDVFAVQLRDRERLTRVKKLLDAGFIKTPQDEWCAAFIFHHGGGEKIDTPELMENFKMAHDLARRSMIHGYEPAKWLYAASLDRILLNQKKLQKYGTHYRKKKNGDWYLLPYDPSTTDEERAKYNVPALENAKKKAVLKKDDWNNRGVFKSS